jgi:RecG-like helicase
MSPEEKDDVMGKFSEIGSEMSILVSTTVIEFLK